MDNAKENKYHFAREVIYNLRSCHAISNAVYLHWIDKLIKDEKESKNTVDLADITCKCVTKINTDGNWTIETCNHCR